MNVSNREPAEKSDNHVSRKRTNIAPSLRDVSEFFCEPAPLVKRFSFKFLESNNIRIRTSQDGFQRLVLFAARFSDTVFNIVCSYADLSSVGGKHEQEKTQENKDWNKTPDPMKSFRTLGVYLHVVTKTLKDTGSEPVC